MEFFTNDVMRGLLQSLKTASLDGGAWKDSGEGPGSTAGDYIEWLPIRDRLSSSPAGRQQQVWPELSFWQARPSCLVFARAMERRGLVRCERI